MKLMFDSSCKHFLELYEPQVTLLDDIEICADSYAVDYFLEELQQLNPNKADLSYKALKNNYGLKIDKNHVVIPKGSELIIQDMGKKYEEMTVLLKDLTIKMYITYGADFAFIEATPINKEYETIFANKFVPKEKDNILLYGINIVDLVNATNYMYAELDKNQAYEYLKVLPKEEILNNHKNWEKYNKTLEKELKNLKTMI